MLADMRPSAVRSLGAAFLLSVSGREHLYFNTSLKRVYSSGRVRHFKFAWSRVFIKCGCYFQICIHLS